MSADTEKLHTVVHDGNGPPALIVHGALGSRSYWDDNVATLAEVCAPVVIELWGHGRSPSPADTNRYRPSGYVAEFERIRCELGASQIWVIGQSMGAALVLHYVLAYAERVIGAVLTNGTEEGRFQRLLPTVRLIPGVEIVDVAASHAVNAQDPAGWNATTTSFMRHHSSGTPRTH